MDESWDAGQCSDDGGDDADDDYDGGGDDRGGSVSLALGIHTYPPLSSISNCHHETSNIHKGQHMLQ